jgi:hypothetical protein
MAILTQNKLYVAFIDILGFSKFLNDENFAEKIESLVTALRKRVDFDSDHHRYLKYLAVSDSIIITAEKDHSPHLLWKISQVQNELLRIGFAARGGVAFGEVYAHLEGNGIRNIFGKAYVAAYQIERTFSIYPRVVIDSELADTIRTEFSGAKKEPYEDFVLADIDGCLFANQFVREEVHLKSGVTKLINEAQKSRAEYLRRVAEGLTTKDPRALMKWRWLSDQLNKRLNVGST